MLCFPVKPPWFLVRFVPWGLHSRSRWLLKWSIHRRFLQQKNKTFMHSWLCKMSVNGALRADPLRGLAMRKKPLDIVSHNVRGNYGRWFNFKCSLRADDVKYDETMMLIHCSQLRKLPGRRRLTDIFMSAGLSTSWALQGQKECHTNISRSNHAHARTHSSTPWLLLWRKLHRHQWTPLLKQQSDIWSYIIDITLSHVIIRPQPAALV